MKTVFISFTVLCVLVLATSALFAADLALPPIIKYGISLPKYHPELCLESRKSFPGQELKPDKTCKSGLRWTYSE